MADHAFMFEQRMSIENMTWAAIRAPGGIPERSSHGMVSNGKDLVFVFGGNTTDDEGLILLRAPDLNGQESLCLSATCIS